MPTFSDMSVTGRRNETEDTEQHTTSSPAAEEQSSPLATTTTDLETGKYII